MTINLQGLDITYPAAASNGHATTIRGEDLGEGNEFIGNGEDGMTMRAPRFGASTEHVKRTRAEAKERKAWKISSAKQHRMQLSFTLDSVIEGGRVCVAQIHVHGQDNPPVKVIYDNGSIKSAVRRKDVKSDPSQSVIGQGFELGKRIDLTLGLDEEGDLSVSATQGERAANFGDKLDLKSWGDNEFVFHAGPYNQKDRGAKDEGDETVMQILALDIQHEPADDGSSQEESQTPAGHPLTTVKQFQAELDRLGAQPIPRFERLERLNAVTDMVDQSELSDEEQAPLYAHIRELKKLK